MVNIQQTDLNGMVEVFKVLSYSYKLAQKV